MSFGWAPLGRVKAGYYNSACITIEADKSLIILGFSFSSPSSDASMNDASCSPAINCQLTFPKTFPQKENIERETRGREEMTGARREGSL